MNALTLVFVALCVFALAYRFYGLFIANRVLELKVERLTPADKMADGIDYVKTNKFILFGHHFAAIAAAGPLLGPVLAAQYGYLTSRIPPRPSFTLIPLLRPAASAPSTLAFTGPCAWLPCG